MQIEEKKKEIFRMNRSRRMRGGKHISLMKGTDGQCMVVELSMQYCGQVFVGFI